MGRVDPEARIEAPDHRARGPSDGIHRPITTSKEKRAQMDFKARLKQISQAKPKGKGGGPYFQPGRGVLIVKGFRFGETEKAPKQELFVADYFVEKSTSFPEGTIITSGDGKNAEPGNSTKANAPGTSLSYPQNITKFPDTAPSNAKDAVVMAARGVQEFDPETLSEADADELLGEALDPSNPLRGVRVGYETRQVKTKKGSWITVTDFIPLSGQTSEEVAQRRAQLDQGEAYSQKISDEV